MEWNGMEWNGLDWKDGRKEEGRERGENTLSLPVRMHTSDIPIEFGSSYVSLMRFLTTSSTSWRALLRPSILCPQMTTRVELLTLPYITHRSIFSPQMTTGVELLPLPYSTLTPTLQGRGVDSHSPLSVPLAGAPHGLYLVREADVH